MGNTGGTITVEIDRDTRQTSLIDGGIIPPIDGFTITDEGVGFNDANFGSFKQLDSAYKSDLGCKGIGRILWIWEFHRAEIDSTYIEDNTLKHRSFTFDTQDEVNEIEPRSIGDSKVGSKVRLIHCREEFKKELQKTDHEKLANRILEHCILYFINEKVPKIIVKDSNDFTVVNTLFEAYIKEKTLVFTLNDNEFRMFIVRNYRSKSKGNHLWLCAYSRSIKGCHKHVSGLRMVDPEKGAFVVDCYISSNYLDDRVNNTWSDFESIDRVNLFSDTTEDAICKAAVDEIRDFFSKELGADRVERQRKMDKLLDEYPQYRYYVHSHPEILDKMDMDGKETERTNIELINNEISALESQVIFSLKDLRKGKDVFKNYSKIDEEFKKLDEVNRNNLCKYMVHRRIILELYEEAMRYEDGTMKYPRENYIHDLLLPRGTSSKDGYNPYECNLWVLDERLNFFGFFESYSDGKIKDIVDSDSDDRPDVVIFTNGDGMYAHNVAIVELKRYKRDDENLSEQMLDYVKQIRDGQLTRRDGRKLDVRNDTTYFCYGICELRGSKYEEWLVDRNFIPIDGGTCMYCRFDRLNAHLYIMDMNLVLDTAQKRNKIFFDILGMSDDRD